MDFVGNFLYGSLWSINWVISALHLNCCILLNTTNFVEKGHFSSFEIGHGFNLVEGRGWGSSLIVLQRNEF